MSEGKIDLDNGKVDLDVFDEVNSAFWDGVVEERDWLRTVVSDMAACIGHPAMVADDALTRLGNPSLKGILKRPDRPGIWLFKPADGGDVVCLEVDVAGCTDEVGRGYDMWYVLNTSNEPSGIGDCTPVNDLDGGWRFVQEADEPTLGNPSVPEPTEDDPAFKPGYVPLFGLHDEPKLTPNPYCGCSYCTAARLFKPTIGNPSVPEPDEPEPWAIAEYSDGFLGQFERLAVNGLRGELDKVLALNKELTREVNRLRHSYRGKFSTLPPDSEGPWIYIDEYGIWRMFVSKRWDGSLLASHSHFHLGKPFLGPVADLPGKWAKEE